MNLKYKISFIIFMVLFAISCKKHLHSNKETVLARVGEEYLYISDISNNLPSEISKADSLQMIHRMVNNWVKQELLLLHANRNLPDSLKDFSEQIKIYHNNLIIYEFKKRLVEQKLDTVIKQEEIEEYYNNHQKDFQLKENIVQFSFLKIPVQSDSLEQARELIKKMNDTVVDRTLAEKFCQNNTVDYFLNNEQWIPFNDLLKSVPIETFNQEIYLKNNHIIEIKDHPYWYFINLRNFKIKEDVSPLSFETGKIKSIILNQRKLELLKNIEEEIRKEASHTNQFEIY